MLPEQLTITYLEMFEPPPGPARALPDSTRVERLLEPTVEYYRYLYSAVGRPWHWQDRLGISDESLATLIQAPDVEIYVLYHRGHPAGYLELECAEEETKIAYFGLIGEFLGRGLGGFFLDWSVRRAFRPGVRRIWLHTCNMDAPAALPNYQKAGFQTFDQKTGSNPYLTRVRYAHTNLIAADWRSLADYYVRTFGCRKLKPVRDLSGPELEAGTGVERAHLTGVHLLLPGGGPLGPTLEIYSYHPNAPHQPRPVHQPGLGHLAFHVLDLPAVLQRVRAHGGQLLGEVVTTSVDHEREVHWCYTRDPEGNVVELCHYRRRCISSSS